MVRFVVAVVCGVIAGGVFNTAGVVLSWAMYRPPDGANMSDPETLKLYIQSLPPPAFLVILVAHAGGALVGGFVAARIARRAPLVLGAIVGGFFLVGGVVNAVSIPRPLWFAVVDLISYLPAGVAGAKLAPPRGGSRATAPPARPSPTAGS